MRKLLLTTTLALPLTFGAAFAQDTAPAADPAMEPAETAPMTDAGTGDMATGDMATDDMATEDADEAAAAASAAEKVEVQQAENEWRIDWITGASVTSPDGTDIGSISDLIVDEDTGEMKAAITGSGRADKQQVGAMVTRVLRLAESPRPADAADALGLAICHVWRGGAQARIAAAVRRQAAPASPARPRPSVEHHRKLPRQVRRVPQAGDQTLTDKGGRDGTL